MECKWAIQLSQATAISKAGVSVIAVLSLTLWGWLPTSYGTTSSADVHVTWFVCEQLCLQSSSRSNCVRGLAQMFSAALMQRMLGAFVHGGLEWSVCVPRRDWYIFVGRVDIIIRNPSSPVARLHWLSCILFLNLEANIRRLLPASDDAGMHIRHHLRTKDHANRRSPENEDVHSMTGPCKCDVPSERRTTHTESG